MTIVYIHVVPIDILTSEIEQTQYFNYSTSEIILNRDNKVYISEMQFHHVSHVERKKKQTNQHEPSENDVSSVKE